MKLKRLIKLATFFTVLLLLAACSNTHASLTYETPLDANVHDEEIHLLDFSQYNIVVNNSGLEDTFLYTLGESDTPTHVPLREVLEALGIRPLYNTETHQITLEGVEGSISITRDSEDFWVNGDIITIPGLPAIIVDGTAYVPVQFFTEVLGIGNAYYSNGSIFIYD